jgi:DNA-binding transcriptional ArsR family regulator
MNGHMTVNIDVLGVAPIQDLEALRALVDSQRHRIVTLLMEEPLTAKELAARLGIGRTRLYYHLTILETHGLIRVVDTRIVSGIAERTYRAVARTFRVDRALLASQASEEQISEAQAAIIEAVANDLRARAASGEPASDADILVSRTFLCLNESRRAELRARLGALIEEYRSADRDWVETELALALFAPERSAQ